MKKQIILISLALVTLSSCGFVFGGKISACQKADRVKGEPRKKVRWFAIIGDIAVVPLLGPFPILIDGLLGSVYKPCEFAPNNILNTEKPQTKSQ